MNKINIYDFDGTITAGVHPVAGSIILTGRCMDEKHIVFEYFKDHNLNIEDYAFYFNPILYAQRGDHDEKSRNSSAKHKSNIINQLISNGVEIGLYFEDDPLQIDIVCDGNPEIKPKIVQIPQTTEF